MKAKLSQEQAKAMAAQNGIDLGKLDWAKILQFVQMILTWLQGTQGVASSQDIRAKLKAAGCPDDELDHCCACCEAACLSLQSAELSLSCCGDCCTKS